MTNMENKNTIYYDKNIIISWEKITFVPQAGDKFSIEEDKFMAIGAFAEFADPEPGKELFVTDDFDVEAAAQNHWTVCHPIEFGGKKYGMVGCKIGEVGHFFLYEME